MRIPNTPLDDSTEAQERILTNEATPLLDDARGAQHSATVGNNSHAHGSMNMRALVLHVMGDALGNVGVIATGLVIWLSDWKYKYYFDPVISLVITCIIFSSAMPLGKSRFLHVRLLNPNFGLQFAVPLSFSYKAYPQPYLWMLSGIPSSMWTV
jgi:hypothetical protein